MIVSNNGAPTLTYSNQFVAACNSVTINPATGPQRQRRRPDYRRAEREHLHRQPLNLIYQPGQVLSNAFTVGLSNAGEFNVFGERTIDVVVGVSVTSRLSMVRHQQTAATNQPPSTFTAAHRHSGLRIFRKITTNSCGDG